MNKFKLVKRLERRVEEVAVVAKPAHSSALDPPPPPTLNQDLPPIPRPLASKAFLWYHETRRKVQDRTK